MAAFAAPLMWATMMGSAAFAGTIYQGADYSYSTSSNRRAVICDKEADGRTAYVVYEWGNLKQHRINDMDGSSGSCWWNATEEKTSVMEHKTCEDINNWPDACSKWSSHY